MVRSMKKTEKDLKWGSKKGINNKVLLRRKYQSNTVVFSEENYFIAKASIFLT